MKFREGGAVVRLGTGETHDLVPLCGEHLCGGEANALACASDDEGVFHLRVSGEEDQRVLKR